MPLLSSDLICNRLAEHLLAKLNDNDGVSGQKCPKLSRNRPSCTIQLGCLSCRPNSSTRCERHSTNAAFTKIIQNSPSPLEYIFYHRELFQFNTQSSATGYRYMHVRLNGTRVNGKECAHNLRRGPRRFPSHASDFCKAKRQD